MTLDNPEGLAFGLMGRLHVLLRREIGRVTDIKYMGINPEYCLHVLELAESVSNPDLQVISRKLEEIFFGEQGLFHDSPVKPRRYQVAASSRVSIPVDSHQPPAPLLAEPELAQETEQHYVGRLR